MNEKIEAIMLKDLPDMTALEYCIWIAYVTGTKSPAAQAAAELAELRAAVDALGKLLAVADGHTSEFTQHHYKDVFDAARTALAALEKAGGE